MWKNLLLGWRSPAAPIDNAFERGELIHKFRMLKRWYRVGSSGCSLNNIPLVPKLRLPLLRRHFVRFSRSTFDAVPTYHGFVPAAVFLHALTTVCVASSSICTTYEFIP